MTSEHDKALHVICVGQGYLVLQINLNLDSQNLKFYLVFLASWAFDRFYQASVPQIT